MGNGFIPAMLIFKKQNREISLYESKKMPRYSIIYVPQNIKSNRGLL